MENSINIRKQTEEFITINDLWHICLAHWHWFMLSLVVCLGFASYYLAVTPSIYKREAAILVKQESISKNASKSQDSEVLSDVSVVQQQTSVPNVQRQLVSLEVLREVASRLQMANDDAQSLKVAQQLAGRIKVKVEDEKSSIINLSVVDVSPVMAEQILSTTVQVFNEKWLADKNKIAASTSAFIQERLSLLEGDLGVVDDSISNFKARNHITDINRISDVYLQQQSASDAQILTLSNQKSMALYILGILRDKETQHQLLPTNSGINNSVAETQISQYNNMLLQLKNSMYGTSSQNPLILKQESDLSDIRKNIAATIQNHIKALDIQLDSYIDASGEAGSKIIQNPDQAKHLLGIEREQKVKESLYLYLLQKKEEAEISTTYKSYITEMIDQPHGSDAPISPNPRNIIFIAVLLALLVPTIVLFVRENMDNTVRDKFDVENRTTISLIGEIPLYIFDEAKNKNIAAPKHKITRLAELLSISKPSTPSPLVVQPDRQDIVNEAFRVIRTNLEFMTSKNSDKNVYIVTSSHEGSGKTFVASNLSIALAIRGNRVLLVDGDLRHAAASKHFNAHTIGIADYLANKETELEHVIMHHPDYNTLNILPVGTIPPNPTELLSSERFVEMIKELRQKYDFIIIDCPPAEVLADAGIIERQADRTLFIVRAGLYERKRLEYLETSAHNGKYKHMSLILNGIRLGRRYGYRYGYRYQYKYANDLAYYGKDENSSNLLGRLSKRFFLTILSLSAVLTSLTSCDNETYSEYERVKTGFLQDIKGNIDPSHLWKTVVTVKVETDTELPVSLTSYMTIEGKTVVTDSKKLPAGGGTVDLSVPQGKGLTVTVKATNGKKTVTQNLKLNGSLYETVVINMTGNSKNSVAQAPRRSDYIVAEKDEWGNHHSTNPALWGNSRLGSDDTPLFYTNWPVDIWRYVCKFAGESVDPSTLGETVNFELESKGPFDITLFCGQLGATSAATMGYYYYTEGSFTDYREVDLCDIHQYDYLDGKPIIQYMHSGEWWDANYDMYDWEDGYLGRNPAREGDDCFNSVAMASKGDISAMRGLTFHIDIPEGKRMGFYIRQDGVDNIVQEFNQRQHLHELGIPNDKMHTPFKITGFSSSLFNKTYDTLKPYRAWIHTTDEFYFMGLEDAWDTSNCDHDCNDVMFAMSAGSIGVLPEIIDLDNNEDTPESQKDTINLPWTLAFEDVYRNADFDFNDGVILIRPNYETEEACVTVLAAGIDERVILHYAAPDGTDMVLGELHEMLGRSSDRPVNTGSSSLEVPCVEIDCVPWPEGFTMANDASRFTLEVIRGACQGECSDWLTLTDEPGAVPEALLVAGKWEWPKEGIHITNAYSHFNYWAKDATNPNLWNWYSEPRQGTFVNY